MKDSEGEKMKSRPCKYCGDSAFGRRGTAVCKKCNKKSEPKMLPGYISPLRNEDRRAEILKLYLSGMSMKSVASEIGITKQRVSQVIKCMGVKARPKNSSKLDLVKAFEMRKDGMLYKEMAPTLGVSESTLSSKLKALGKPQREPSPDKKCSRCQQIKPRDMFYKPAGWCKACHNEYHRIKKAKQRVAQYPHHQLEGSVL